MDDNKINLAVTFMAHHHTGQIRKHSRLPYIIHPLEVVKQIYGWKISDSDVWITTLLHDTLEDTKATAQEIESQFGPKVANWVKQLTFIPFEKDNKAAKNEYLKSFFIKDVEVLVIKVADRLCNVRDFLSHDPKYAKIYFHRAESLYEALKQREKEINQAFGDNTAERINASYGDLYDRLTT